MRPQRTKGVHFRSQVHQIVEIPDSHVNLVFWHRNKNEFWEAKCNSHD
jgi:hypothetical protein